MLLALDTSSQNIGIALYDGAQTLNEAVWASANYHTVELAPAVEAALGRARMEVGDLEAIGVAIGPGSFTGLRIGLGFAKGLALARHIPIIGIPTLDILAAAQPVTEDTLAAAMQVGRERLAVGWYKAVDGLWKPKGDPEILTVKELSQRIRKPTQVCGELDEAGRRLLSRKRKNVILASPALCVRRPAFLAELAWERWQAGKADDPAALSPHYLSQGEPLPS